MVYKNHHKANIVGNTSKTTATSKVSLHTPEQAVTFVQTTYNDYLTAINNIPTGNTQPIGLVGLAAVKDDLTPSFYTQASATNDTTHNGFLFNCDSQSEVNSYVASLMSDNSTSAQVTVIRDGETSFPMSVNVDLASLKITGVNCGELDSH